MSILKSIEKGGRKVFNSYINIVTKNAQKKYGFEIGTGEHATWNNEADAFKHAYMSWFLSFWGSDIKSKELGDMHEDETPDAPAYERNMDLWNNAIGREIAYEMKWRLGEDYYILGEEWVNEIAREKIWEKMQQGELITDPFTDRRKFENMELERLTENDRVYTNDEFRNFDEKMKEINLNNYLDYVINNDWESPTVKNLNKRVLSGELIYVDNYIRSDGTKVDGYYRRRPYYARKK